MNIHAISVLTTTVLHYFRSFVVLGALSLFSVSSHATLTDLNNGLVVDTTTNIYWLKNWDLAATQTFGVAGVHQDGRMNWDVAQQWINKLNSANYLGHNNWIIPQIVDLRDLYNVSLGNSFVEPNSSPAHVGPFLNINTSSVNVGYWSNTRDLTPFPQSHYFLCPLCTYPGESLHTGNNAGDYFVLPRLQSAPVPEPSTWFLLALGIVAIYLRSKRTKAC